MQYQVLVRSVAQRLQRAGVEPYEYEARVLVAHACGISMQELNRRVLLREELQEDAADTHASHISQGNAQGNAQINAQVNAQLEHMVQRREAREPLQHIIGVAHFRYLQLQVGAGVFIPRPETEQVVQIALDWIAQHTDNTVGTPSASDAPTIRVVDLCAGSGAIGLSMVRECEQSEVWAVELSEQAYQWTMRNAQSVLSEAEQQRYHLTLGDATAAQSLCELDGTVDIVLTNPPYIPLSQPVEQPEVRDYDPHMALYGGSDDGLQIPEAILKRSYMLLRKGGLLVMEHDASQGQALVQAATQFGLPQAHTVQDFVGRDRFLVALR